MERELEIEIRLSVDAAKVLLGAVASRSRVLGKGRAHEALVGIKRDLLAKLKQALAAAATQSPATPAAEVVEAVPMVEKVAGYKSQSLVN